MEVEKEAVIFGIGFTALIALLILRFGPVDWWGAFYLRNAQTALEEQALRYDELSYLGRSFTYPPVFFHIAAQLPLLFGQHTYEAVRLPFHLLAVFIYFTSLYLLFRNFRRWQERVAGASIFATHAFVLIFSSTVTLHVLAYSFLNLSLLLLERKGFLKLLSALFLSFALSSHPTCLLLFPVYVYAMGHFRIDWGRVKNAALILLSASLLSLVFYLPIFIRSGLPYETAPTLWGYLLSYGFIGLVYDFQFLIPLILLTSLFAVVRKPLQLAALLLVLVVLVNALIAYRTNLIVTIMLSFLFPLVFGEKLKDSFVLSTFFLFILANLLFIPVLFSGTTNWCRWVFANSMCTKPMSFINQYTSTNENVAINPEFGHLEAYLGGRRVLADLYVEYAPAEKFYSEYNFYQEANPAYVKEYNITLLVLDDTGMLRDIPDMDRVYDNSFIHMYRAD